VPFVLRLLDEVVAVVRAVGTAPSDDFLSAARDQLTTKGSSFASSMYRDLQQGRPIEVEEIVGDLLRRGTECAAASNRLHPSCTLSEQDHPAAIGEHDPCSFRRLRSQFTEQSMPLARMDMIKVKSPEYRGTVAGVAHQAMVDILKAPER
jgi:hypothetical protein